MPSTYRRHRAAAAVYPEGNRARGQAPPLRRRRSPRNSSGLPYPTSSLVVGVLCAFGWLLLVPSLVPWAWADEPADDTTQVIENVRGTVKKVGNFGFGLVPDTDPGTRYAPVEPLPEEFRQDGLAVIFSGELGSPDEGLSLPDEGRGRGQGRRWGTPIRITRIEKAPDAEGSDGRH